MEQQRPFLYLSLFFLCFLIWSTWTQRNAPVAPPVSQTTSTDSSQIAVPTSVPTAIPSAAENTTASAVPLN